MTEPPQDRVECYSGYTYAQEPRVVLWMGRRYPVSRVEARWQTPEGPAFLVRADQGDRFELRYNIGAGQWSIRALPADHQE
jgi:hypothetical protein